jgi:hypothetical protein
VLIVLSSQVLWQASLLNRASQANFPNGCQSSQYSVDKKTMREERKEVQFSNMKPVRRKDTNKWQLTWLS